MRRNSKALQKAIMARLTDNRVRVPIEYLRTGDIIEYTMSGIRCGRVEHIHPRARKLRVGRFSKKDLPKKWRSLANYVKTVRVDGTPKTVRYKPSGVTIHESQVTGVLTGRMGKRTTLRPGTTEYDTFVAKRNP